MWQRIFLGLKSTICGTSSLPLFLLAQTWDEQPHENNNIPCFANQPPSNYDIFPMNLQSLYNSSKERFRTVVRTTIPSDFGDPVARNRSRMVGYSYLLPRGPPFLLWMHKNSDNPHPKCIFDPVNKGMHYQICSASWILGCPRKLVKG